MWLVLILAAFRVAPASAQMLCLRDPESPPSVLLDQMAMCRNLNYAYCVEGSETTETELDLLTLSEDARIVSEFSDLFGDDQFRTPGCTHAWLNYQCSKTFLRSDSNGICQSVCTAMEAECGGVIRCSASMDLTSRCTDFLAASSQNGEQCFVAVGERDEDSPVFQPTPPRFSSGSCRVKVGIIFLLVTINFILL